jgi:hypothetical protein
MHHKKWLAALWGKGRRGERRKEKERRDLGYPVRVVAISLDVATHHRVSAGLGGCGGNPATVSLTPLSY